MKPSRMLNQCESSVPYPVTHMMRNGRLSTRTSELQEERTIDVFVNGTATMRITCSNSNFGELAIGRLFLDGTIDSAEDLALVVVDEQQPCVRVTLAHSWVSRTSSEDAGIPRRARTLAAWSAESVFRIADEFALDKTAHARTRGAHSAFLCDLRGNVLCMREDIGRHNAFDKAVGWAVVNNIDLPSCMLYTSGRVPEDVVAKAIRADIPVLISKSVATDKAVVAAKVAGLTLICESKPEGFNVVSSPLTSRGLIVCDETRQNDAIVFSSADDRENRSVRRSHIRI